MLEQLYKSLYKITLLFILNIIGYSAVMAQNSKEFNVSAPIILEFYTSQSCIDCIDINNAIKHMKSNHILALEFHVDHLDKYGWKDSHAIQSASERQNIYMQNFRQTTMALPYVVVQGTHSTIGSRERTLLKNIKDIENNIFEISDILFDARLSKSGEYIDITLDGRGNIGGEFDLWLISYDSNTKTYIGSGPNRGKTLRGKNIVQDITKLSKWTGESRSFPIQRRSINGKDGAVIIIQEQNNGPIITARNILF